MIIKSPLQERNIKPNRRKSEESSRKYSSAKFHTNGNGHSSANVYGVRNKKKGKSGNGQKSKMSIPKIAPWKVIMTSILIGVFGLLYLTHVFQTQQLLKEVNKLEHQYNKAKRKHAEYRLIYDRMIGPSEIYGKAKKRGFINGGPAEKVITIDK